MMGEPSSVLMAANRSPGQNCSRIVLRMLVVEQRGGGGGGGGGGKKKKKKKKKGGGGTPRRLDESVNGQLPTWRTKVTPGRGDAGACSAARDREQRHGNELWWVPASGIALPRRGEVGP